MQSRMQLTAAKYAKDKIRRKKEYQVITHFKRLSSKAQFFNVLLG